jgi:hypothetical protein
VAYVGQAEVGWPASRCVNTFPAGTGVDQTAASRTWVTTRPPDVIWRALDELWEVTGRGAKPLGRWSVDATAGDGSPEVCHEQVLEELRMFGLSGRPPSGSGTIPHSRRNENAEPVGHLIGRGHRLEPVPKGVRDRIPPAQ